MTSCSPSCTPLTAWASAPSPTCTPAPSCCSRPTPTQVRGGGLGLDVGLALPPATAACLAWCLQTSGIRTGREGTQGQEERNPTFIGFLASSLCDAASCEMRFARTLGGKKPDPLISAHRTVPECDPGKLSVCLCISSVLVCWCPPHGPCPGRAVGTAGHFCCRSKWHWAKLNPWSTQLKFPCSLRL